MIEAGWRYGAIGIECKASGMKVNTGLAQMLDYGRSVWRVGPAQVGVWLDWVLLWPLPATGGFAGSYMAQNRLGSAISTDSKPLEFNSGNNILSVYRDGSVRVGACRNGLKVGSR